MAMAPQFALARRNKAWWYKNDMLLQLQLRCISAFGLEPGFVANIIVLLHNALNIKCL